MNSKWKNDRQDVLDLINAVSLKCLDCSCWNRNEVEKCADNDCPLYPYRMDGTNTKAKIASLMEARGNIPSKH